MIPRPREEHAGLLTPLQRRYLRSLISSDASKRPVNPSVSAAAQLVSTLNLFPTDTGGVTSFFGANKFMGYHSEALSIAVMQALAQIGDDSDLELIRRIAANPVQQAALQAQSRLEARVKTVTERETHLRAAIAPATDPEALLRAAQPGTAPHDPATFVRAVDPEPQTQSLSL